MLTDTDALLRRPVHVACGLVLHPTWLDFVLCLKRRPDAEFGGQWCFPGGKVEEDEGGMVALARELREEVGLSRIHVDSVYPLFSTTFAPPVVRQTAHLHYHVVYDFEGHPFAAEPNTEVAWFAWHTLAQHNLTPGTRAIYDHLGAGWLDRQRPLRERYRAARGPYFPARPPHTILFAR